MRYDPSLTVHLLDRPPLSIGAGKTQPHAPFYVADPWWRIKNDRPWFHLRYHSRVPLTREADFPPHVLKTESTRNQFLTLHVLTVHSFDETSDDVYLHPHETYDPGSLARTFAACLEVSETRDHPQSDCSLYETDFLYRKIRKRKGGEVFRLDYVTDEPLGAFVTPEEVSYDALPDLLFRETPVLETRRERNNRTWAERRAKTAAEAAT